MDAQERFRRHGEAVFREHTCDVGCHAIGFLALRGYCAAVSDCVVGVYLPSELVLVNLAFYIAGRLSIELGRRLQPVNRLKALRRLYTVVPCCTIIGFGVSIVALVYPVSHVALPS